MSAIREMVLAEPLFDTHEHQNGYALIEGGKAKLDYQAFLGYATADLVTAAGGAVDMASADSVFKAWSFARTTGYGQATQLACKLLTGLSYTRENAEAISRALRQFVADKTPAAIYEKLYAMANVKWAVCDECWDSPTKLHYFSGQEHPSFFRHALRCDSIIGLKAREQVQQFERIADRSIQSLKDLDAAMDGYAEKARQGGKLAAFKCGLAYLGTLEFQNSSFAVAETIFEAIMQGRVVDPRPLTAYLFHRLVQRAGDFKLPLQVHTGYLAGNWGNPAQGDPTPLIPVFQRYRNVKFDLFHAGWPYCELMGTIGKAFPNVYLDLCWAWSMNPATIERVLYEWLAGVPHNRIFAFGADTGLPYVMLGYAAQARQGVANVLERKVASGEFDTETAMQVARRIMHQNARELYGME